MKLNWKKYCEISTIDGFAYIVKGKNAVERFFWIFSFIASAICTAILINKLFVKLNHFPIVVYMSDKAVPASEVHFPAITICPDFMLAFPVSARNGFPNYQQFRFFKHTMEKNFFEKEELMEETKDEREIFRANYQLILEMLRQGLIYANRLGPKLLKRLQVVDLLTHQQIFERLNFSIPNDDFVDVLNFFAKMFETHDFEIQFDWIGELEQYVSEIITEYGLCFTFNMAFSNDSLNLSSTSDDFHYKLFYNRKNSGVTESYARTLWDSGTLVPRLPEVLPRNLSSHLSGLMISFFVTKPREIYELNQDQTVIYIHDPYEVPSEFSKKLSIESNRGPSFTIEPEMYSIDEDVAAFNPQERNCYLEHEKRLKYFKKYTKANCFQECLSAFVTQRCQCVEYFMMRDQKTRICSASEAPCYTKAKQDFEEIQASCECLDQCNYVKYNLNVKNKYLRLMKRRADIKRLYLYTSYKSSNINHFIRKMPFDKADLLSFGGGLLGLLAGFSVLSFVEVIYWFTFRFIIGNSLKSSRIVPDEENLETPKIGNRIIRHTLAYFKESVIHGFKFVSEFHFIDRLFWIFIITLSFVSCIHLILETEEKISSSLITAYQDPSRFTGNLTFPAITVVADYFIPVSNNYFWMDEVQFELILNESLRNQAAQNLTLNCLCYENCLEVIGLESFFVLPNIRNVPENNEKLSWFQNQFSSWNGKFQPIFAEIFTQRGIAYTFNIIDVDELLNLDSIHPHFGYASNVTTRIKEYPVGYAKNIKMGVIQKSELELNLKGFSPNRVQCLPVSIIVHDQDEHPFFIKRYEFIEIFYGVELDIEITPEVTTTDENLRKLEPVERECYFDDERSLKYFKRYSQKNCIIECLANYTLEVCNCSSFTLPYSENASICSTVHGGDEYCPSKANSEFHSIENFEEICSCLPSCNFIKYHLDYFTRFETQDWEISINVRFNTENAIFFYRSQQFSFPDVVSHIGGLLGLFAGISVLSVVEVFYFFFLRVIVDVWRSARL